MNNPQTIVYRPSDGKILDRLPRDCGEFHNLKDRAVFIADVDESVTHVTEKTIPTGQRTKVIRAKKSTEITADTITTVDVLIEDVGDKKTRDALKAIKALIVKELPFE